ncbi:40s ribosomal protein s5-1 [Hordeum vulgare]|nr:40s ribosomal protein s5-1 [Hordeum vulgare]
METKLDVMEQQVFKCQWMVERGLNANHMMITEFTNKHKMDANDIGKHLSRLYDRVDQLQGQIYDPQNQNCTQERRQGEAGAVGKRVAAGEARQGRDRNQLAIGGSLAGVVHFCGREEATAIALLLHGSSTEMVTNCRGEEG